MKKNPFKHLSNLGGEKFTHEFIRKKYKWKKKEKNTNGKIYVII